MEERRTDWITTEELWPLFEQHQNQVFYTAKGLAFTYTIKGGEMFVDKTLQIHYQGHCGKGL